MTPGPAYADTPRLRVVAEPGRTRPKSTAITVASSILLSSAVLLILVVIVGLVLGAWRFTVIDTGSMRPTLNPGDVAVLTSEQPTALKTGQIVAFHPPRQPHLAVIHRVISIERRGNATVIETKGDANNAKDQWRAHIIGNTVWHEALKVPDVGYLAAWSEQRPVRLGVLIAIVGLTVSLLLGQIWKPSSE